MQVAPCSEHPMLSTAGRGFQARAGLRRRDIKTKAACSCEARPLAFGYPYNEEIIVQPRWTCRTSLVGLVALGALGGCHRGKTPVVTEADVAAAQEEAQKELGQARVEAKKDVKSAAKLAGADSREAAQA